MQERRLYVEAEATRHFFNDVQLHGGGIGLVVDGEKGYASLIFGHYGIGCNNTGTARLPAPFGGNWHANLANAWAKFSSLQRVLLQTFQKVCIVICHATIAFGKTFNRNVKVLMPRDFVAHRLTQMLVGTCRTFLSRDILSSLSYLDKSLLLHLVWVHHLQQQESICSCHDEISKSRAHHDQPYQDIWSGWLGILLCLLSSYSLHFCCPPQRYNGKMNWQRYLVTKFIISSILYSQTGISYKRNNKNDGVSIVISNFVEELSLTPKEVALWRRRKTRRNGKEPLI